MSYEVKLEVVFEGDDDVVAVATRMAWEVEAEVLNISDEPGAHWPVVTFTCPNLRSLRKLYLAYEADALPSQAKLDEWVELHKV